jgi:hypothetical protein
MLHVPEGQVVSVDATDPRIAEWYERFYPQTRFAVPLEAMNIGGWTGFESGGKLRAVMGYTFKHTDIVAVDLLLCEPTKTGLASLYSLCAAFKLANAGKTMRFCVELTNERMMGVYEAFGAKPVALVYELKDEPINEHG